MPPPFVVEELLADDQYLYVAVKYLAAVVDDASTRPSQAPAITVVANGYPTSAPRANGVVPYRTEESSWIRVPISELVDGELDVALHVDVHSTTIPLNKNGTSLTWLEESQRKHYRHERGSGPDSDGTFDRGSTTVGGPVYDIVDDRGVKVP